MPRTAWMIAGGAILVSGLLAYSNASLRGENERLTEQLAEAEEALEKRRERASRTARRAERPVRQAAAPPPEQDVEEMLAEVRTDDLLNTPGVEHRLQEEVDQRLKEKIGAQREEWMSRRREEVSDRIVEYAEDAGFSEDLTAELTAIMDDALADTAEIIRARRENHTTQQRADEDMATLREDVRSALTELLGEEEADAFLDEVRGQPKGPLGL